MNSELQMHFNVCCRLTHGDEVNESISHCVNDDE